MNSLIEQLKSKKKKSDFLFTNHIDDRKTEVITLLSNETSYNLFAPTSSGKTYSLIKVAHEAKIKAIIVVPLVVIAQQKEEEFRTEEDPPIHIGCVTGEVKDIHGTVIKPMVIDSQIEAYLFDSSVNVIISTYDSLHRIVEIGKEKIADYILIIDECHNLTTQYNFRYMAIDNLLNLRKSFKKYINVTATPEGSICDATSTKVFSKRQGSKKNPHIRLVSSKTKILNELFLHLKKNPVKRITVIYYDDKIELLKLQEAIKLSITAKHVYLLTSDNKGDDLYNEVIKKQDIPEGTKYLLTTRMLSDGVNIFSKNPKNKVDAFYIVDSSDFLVKRQFVKRFRSGVKNIYEIIKFDEEQANTVIPNIEVRTAELTKLFYGNSLNENGKDAEFIRKIVSNAWSKQYKVKNIDYLIRNGLLQHIHNNILTPSKELTIEYYNTIAEFDVDLQESSYTEDEIKFTEDLFEEVERLVFEDEVMRDWVIKMIHPLISYFLFNSHKINNNLVYKSQWLLESNSKVEVTLENCPEFLRARMGGISKYLNKFKYLLEIGCFKDLALNILSISLAKQNPTLISKFTNSLNYRLDFEILKQSINVEVLRIDELIEDSSLLKGLLEAFPINELDVVRDKPIYKSHLKEGNLILTKNEDIPLDAPHIFHRLSNVELSSKLKTLSGHRTKAKDMFNSIFWTKQVDAAGRHSKPDITIQGYTSLKDVASGVDMNLNESSIGSEKSFYSLVNARAIYLLEIALENSSSEQEKCMILSKIDLYEGNLLRIRA